MVGQGQGEKVCSDDAAAVGVEEEACGCVGVARCGFQTSQEEFSAGAAAKRPTLQQSASSLAKVAARLLSAPQQKTGVPENPDTEARHVGDSAAMLGASRTSQPRQR